MLPILKKIVNSYKIQTMKSGTTLEERAIIAMEILAKQGPVTYEEMLEQAQRIEKRMVESQNLSTAAKHGNHNPARAFKDDTHSAV